MEFKRYGCGCLYLVTGEDQGRLIEYCGDSDGLRIGPETKISTMVLPSNLEKATTVTDAEMNSILNHFSTLVSQGHSANEFRHLVKRFMQGEQL